MALETTSLTFIIEGVFLTIIAIVGLIGNFYSLEVYGRQKEHRLFHHLLLQLAVFDIMYLIFALVVFGLPNFSNHFREEHHELLLPYTLPMLQISLMGSSYSTLALGLERYIAVCRPFVNRRGGIFKTRYFILTVVGFTLVYNIPRFFELKTEHLGYELGDSWGWESGPTEIRKNKIYIWVYVFWMNLIFNNGIPYVGLICCNYKTYQAIKEMEIRLLTLQVHFTKQRRGVLMNQTTFEEVSTEIEIRSNNQNQKMESFTQLDLPQRCLNEDTGSNNSFEMEESGRKRETSLAKLSLYISALFMTCNLSRVIANAYEMIMSGIHGHPDFNWPGWLNDLQCLIHLSLVFTSSANFYIYYYKYSCSFKQPQHSPLRLNQNLTLRTSV